MRQLRLLALAAPALLLVPVVACEDSSSGSATPFTFEAGPGFEAGPTPEAGPLPADDAGVDAADVFVPPAPKGVTVTVLDDVLPKANVRVISQDATGAVLGDAKTDATGKLAIAAAPSMVTVLVTTSGAPSPVSFLAVADGDNLVVRIPPAVLSEQSPTGQYAITFTPGGAGQSVRANVYVGGTYGCQATSDDTSAPAPFTIDLFPTCLAASNTVFAQGTNGQFATDGFSFKKGVAAPVNANMPVNVTLPAWTTPGTTTLKATNIPGGSIQNTSSLYMIAGGASFQANAGTLGNLTSAGQDYVTATGFADAYQAVVRTHDDVGNFTVESSIVRRETTTAPATATLATFDFANSLPYITNAAVDTTTASRPVLTLTSDSPLTAADAGVVVLSWTTATQGNASWTFVVPASAAATFKAPALPTDAEAVTFTPVGGVGVDSVVFFEATQLPSYKEAKLLPISPRATLRLLDESVALPANGTVRLTTLAPPPS